MSASKFIRNFLTVPPVITKENNHHPLRPEGHSNDDTHVQKTQVSTDSHRDNCLRETAIQEKTQEDVKPKLRHSTTAPRQDDFIAVDSDFFLVDSHGFKAQQNDTNCDSSDLKSSAINVENTEEGSFEEAAGDRKLTANQSDDRENSKDVYLTCNSNASCMTNGTESLKFLAKQPQCLTDVANSVITDERLSHPIENDETCSQHKGASENIDSSAVDSPRDDDRPLTGNPEEITDSLSKTRYEAATVSDDDECNSITSSNTEICEETDYQDIEMCEEEAPESVVETSANTLSASLDVSCSFPSQQKLSTQNVTEEKVASSSNCHASVLQTKDDDSCHMQRNGQTLTLKDSHTQPEPIVPTAPNRLSTTDPVSELRYSKSEFVNASKSSRDILYSNNVSQGKVAVATDSPIVNATTSKSRHKSYSSECVNGKRISTAMGVVYDDDDDSCPMNSQCPTTTEKLLSSDQSKVVSEFPSSTSCRSISNHSTSPIYFNFSNVLVFLSPGSTFVIPNSANGTPALCFKSASSMVLANPHSEITLVTLGSIDGIPLMGLVRTNQPCTVGGSGYQVVTTGGSQSPNTTITNSCQVKGHASTVMNVHGITVASGFICVNKGSSLENPNCSTATQMLPSSYRQSNDNHDISSSSFDHSLTSLKLLPDANLVSNREVFVTNAPKKPVASGLIYEVEDSSSDVSQYSTTVREHSSSDHSKATNEVPASLPGQSNNNHGTSRACFSESMASAKLPPGSTLVNNRGVYCIIDKEKPFACGYCGKAFKLRHSVNGHIRLQHEERRYACKFCGKRYAQPSDLAKHAVVHSQEKPFTCDQCGMCFRWKTCLSDHKKTHSKERPFSSKNCRLSFKTKDILKDHCKSHDKDEQREGVPCSICKTKFQSQSILKLHMMVHFEEKPFNCSFCDQKYRFKVDLQMHMNVHNVKMWLRDKKSPVCNKTVASTYIPTHTRMNKSSTTVHEHSSSDHSNANNEVPASLSRQSNNNHGTSGVRFSESMASAKLPPGSTLVSNQGVYRIKDKEKPFACGYCGKPYKLRHSLNGHIKLTHGEQRYACEFCGKRYAQPSDLASHVVSHTQEKPFACDQCGMCFGRKSGLHTHKYTHSEERSFRCKICSKSFRLKGVLTRHLESHDKDQKWKRVICSVCNRKFRSLSDLRMHMMIHSGETPFKCTSCDKQFRLKIQLMKHMNVHRGEKTHKDKQCPVCNKTVSASYLPTHMRMHSGEKPFECSVCGKRFPKKINLEGHMRSHTGEKPFACGGCDKRFALYSNMMTHKAKCKELSVSENVTVGERSVNFP